VPIGAVFLFGNKNISPSQLAKTQVGQILLVCLCLDVQIWAKVHTFLQVHAKLLQKMM